MVDKIKVLIVDDNEDTRNGTRRLLEYEDDLEIIDIAPNGQVAIEKVLELDPDVVLMDINMPVMDGLTATQRLQAEAPRSQVIIVTVQDDQNYMREAIRAGAVDFITKPISSEELAESIRRAYNKIPKHVPAQPGAVPGYATAVPGLDLGGGYSEGHVIAVLGPKGGVGKTTVAVNLAVGLARADKRVLVIDGSLYFGDVGVFLNTRGQYHIGDMAQMMADPADVDTQSVNTILASHESGVRLLVSAAHPGDVSPISAGMMRSMLDYFKEEYDYIIIDTGTYFDEVLVGAIQNADRLVLMTTAAMPSLKDARVMFNELANAEYDLEHVALVLNMVENPPRITSEQIANFLKHPVNVEIPFDPTANEALNRGVPLITLDPRRVPAVQPLLNLIHWIQDSFQRAGQEEAYPEYGRGRGSHFGARRGG